MSEQTILQDLYPEGEYMNSVNVAWKLYYFFQPFKRSYFRNIWNPSLELEASLVNTWILVSLGLHNDFR